MKRSLTGYEQVFDNFYQKYTEEKETIEKGLEAGSGSMSISNLPAFLENAISVSRKLIFRISVVEF